MVQPSVLAMPIWEETPGQTKDMLERLHLSAGLGMSRCPPGGVGGSGWERNIWISILRLLPMLPGPGKAAENKTKQNNHMHNNSRMMAYLGFVKIFVASHNLKMLH